MSVQSLERHDDYMSWLSRQHAERKVDVPEGESGDWSVSKFEVPKHDLRALRLAFEGRGLPPGTYTRLSQKGTGLFMSDTPAEYRDASYFIHRSEGHVLISGLGLGMVVKALLLKEAVASITVVELEPDVIKLVAPSYSNERLRIIQGDAYTWKPDSVFDWAWHDIWADISADDLPDMARICRHYARSMAAPERQMVWGRDIIRNSRYR